MHVRPERPTSGVRPVYAQCTPRARPEQRKSRQMQGFGARRLSGVLGRPGVWRAINLAIGLLLLVLAARLATMPLGG